MKTVKQKKWADLRMRCSNLVTLRGLGSSTRQSQMRRRRRSWNPTPSWPEVQYANQTVRSLKKERRFWRISPYIFVGTRTLNLLKFPPGSWLLGYNYLEFLDSHLRKYSCLKIYDFFYLNISAYVHKNSKRRKPHNQSWRRSWLMKKPEVENLVSVYL